MSPRTRITREQWLAAMSRLLADGVVPADLSLNDLCQGVGVTKGSFYSHFPGGAEELHREIIDRWLRQTDVGTVARTMGTIRDPRDRLRLLRARALETAQSDGAMRRWAAYDAAACAAVAQVDTELTEHVTTAVGDLGLPGEDAAVVADVLVHAFAGAHHTSPVPRPSSPAGFETLLAVLSRAASGQSAQEQGGVEVAPVSAPDEVVVFRIAPGLPAEARRDLRDQAQRFAEQAFAQAKPATQSRGPAQAEPSQVRRGTGA